VAGEGTPLTLMIRLSMNSTSCPPARGQVWRGGRGREDLRNKDIIRIFQTGSPQAPSLPLPPCQCSDFWTPLESGGREVRSEGKRRRGVTHHHPPRPLHQGTRLGSRHRCRWIRPRHDAERRGRRHRSVPLPWREASTPQWTGHQRCCCSSRIFLIEGEVAEAYSAYSLVE
jgi:hypothetical protein